MSFGCRFAARMFTSARVSPVRGGSEYIRISTASKTQFRSFVETNEVPKLHTRSLFAGCMTSAASTTYVTHPTTSAMYLLIPRPLLTHNVVRTTVAELLTVSEGMFTLLKNCIFLPQFFFSWFITSPFFIQMLDDEEGRWKSSQSGFSFLFINPSSSSLLLWYIKIADTALH